MSIGVAVLGSTGSVGRSTLEVLWLNRERFHVPVLAARGNVEVLLEQCARFEPEWAALESPEAARELERRLAAAGSRTPGAARGAAITQLAAHSAGQYVMAGVR